VFVLFALLLFMVPPTAPTLVFSHFERSIDGAEPLAVLKFTNNNSTSVVFETSLSRKGVSPRYLIRTKLNGVWGTAEPAGFPKGVATFYESMSEVRADETITLKFALPSDGTPARVGFRYRTWEATTDQAKLFRIRYLLSEMGLVDMPKFESSMEETWCRDALSAPTNLDDYDPVSPSPIYQPYNPTSYPQTLKDIVGGVTGGSIPSANQRNNFATPPPSPTNSQSVSRGLSYDLPLPTLPERGDETLLLEQFMPSQQSE